MERGKRTCPRCGRLIIELLPRRPGRPKRWCSTRCRRAASEEKRAAANGAIGIRYITAPVTIQDHVAAVLDSPAACRRVLRELGERAAKGELMEARWSSVEAELERLRRPLRRPQIGPTWRR